MESILCECGRPREMSQYSIVWNDLSVSPVWDHGTSRALRPRESTGIYNQILPDAFLGRHFSFVSGALASVGVNRRFAHY